MFRSLLSGGKMQGLMQVNRNLLLFYPYLTLLFNSFISSSEAFVKLMQQRVQSCMIFQSLSEKMGGDFFSLLFVGIFSFFLFLIDINTTTSG